MHVQFDQIFFLTGLVLFETKSPPAVSVQCDRIEYIWACISLQGYRNGNLSRFGALKNLAYHSKFIIAIRPPVKPTEAPTSNPQASAAFFYSGVIVVPLNILAAPSYLIYHFVVSFKAKRPAHAASKTEKKRRASIDNTLRHLSNGGMHSTKKHV